MADPISILGSIFSVIALCTDATKELSELTGPLKGEQHDALIQLYNHIEVYHAIARTLEIEGAVFGTREMSIIDGCVHETVDIVRELRKSLQELKSKSRTRRSFVLFKGNARIQEYATRLDSNTSTLNLFLQIMT
jgi:hypothetical protein